MPKLSDLARRPDFQIGPLSISPSRRQVIGPEGEVHVEPLVMQVFLILLDARGKVVTRDEIFEQCWGGDLVGDSSINRAITLVRRVADQCAPGSFEIENIPRTGYRLVGEIWSSDGEAPAPNGKDGLRRPLARSLIVLTLLIALGFAAFASLRLLRDDPAPITMAVLPFRNLSGGEPYFAEGLGDEISVQLSREPQFRVIGRMSSVQAKDAAAQEVGRKLNVDYVLEGSVRSQAERVRVTTSLVRTSDGIQLWSNNFEGKLDDIFAIQQQIGRSVAGALKLRLVRTRSTPGAIATSGEAQSLYLTARGMLRTREPDLAPGAADLLRQAIRLDPKFAPAWSSLAHAVRYRPPDRGSGHESVIAAMPSAERYARHALSLDPNLGEAHAVLGMLLGFTSPEARRALEKAVRLDPDNVEAQVWLAASYRASGDFGAAMTWYQRAHLLDPSWGRIFRDLGVSTAEMGDRAAAEAIVTRAPMTDADRNNVFGRVAWASGDFSEAIRRWSLASRSPSGSARSRLARGFMEDALVEVGLPGKPLPADWPPNLDGRLENRRVRFTTPPIAAVWRSRNRSPLAARIYQKENRVAAKLMLNAGRTGELVQTFDSQTGLLGMRPGQRLRGDLLRDAPTVALALRQVGRDDEAERLLRQGDAIVREIYRRGPVAFSFDADAAAIWAVQGRQEEALSALERAMHRGWVHISDSDLKDIAAEPAFASLRGHPRFERIRARIRAHYERERQEIARLRI